MIINQYTTSFKRYIQSSNEKEKAIEMLIDFLKENPTNKLLDCGCGTGEITAAVLPYCKKVFAVDKKRRLSDELVNNTKVEFIEGNFLEQEFKEKFDIILAAYLLWEIPFKEWNRTFEKSRDLLGKDGFLCVIDSYPKSKFDNPFFYFDTNLKKLNRYPDWYEYLDAKKVKYKSHPFNSQIVGRDEEDMYEILQFFFQGGEAEKFYKSNKNKIIEDLKSRREKSRLVIGMHHVMDFVYLKQ